MHVMAQEPNGRLAEWMQANRKELMKRIARVMHEDGTKEVLPGLTQPLPGVFEPAVCITALGSKENRSTSKPKRKQLLPKTRRRWPMRKGQHENRLFQTNTRRR
ncbi:MAG TPA: hypothetical protein VFB12_16530 [Ktedonobacteraceae bacterium]|nr:hypothetical protein [Ktedonobacteraceae bacterium]